LPMIQIIVDDETHEKFKIGCWKKKTNMSDVLRADIDRHLAEWGEKVAFETVTDRPDGKGDGKG
jgi:hypothetical protein